jgi:hypothetical protein
MFPKFVRLRSRFHTDVTAAQARPTQAQILASCAAPERRLHWAGWLSVISAHGVSTLHTTFDLLAGLGLVCAKRWAALLMSAAPAAGTTALLLQRFSSRMPPQCLNTARFSPRESWGVSIYPQCDSHLGCPGLVYYIT